MVIHLQITGMTCAGCVKSVERALRGVPGVTNVSVDLTSGTADVAAGDGDLLAIQTHLLSALDDAGFSGTATPNLRH